MKNLSFACQKDNSLSFPACLLHFRLLTFPSLMCVFSLLLLTVDSGGTVVLVSQDGIQRPPLRFPRGGHLLQFLSCLENGLLPHGQLDPPLWSQRGKVGTQGWASSCEPTHGGFLLPCMPFGTSQSSSAAQHERRLHFKQHLVHPPQPKQKKWDVMVWFSWTLPCSPRPVCRDGLMCSLRDPKLDPKAAPAQRTCRHHPC